MKNKRMIAFFICILWFSAAAFAEASDQTQRPFSAEGLFTAPEESAVEAGTWFPARVEKSGQTRSYAARDDGALHKGVAWPNPRFTDNGDGTVADNLTGLVWLKDAGCKKFWASDPKRHNKRGWNGALAAANKLEHGYCGLNDDSIQGEWRLPNIKELQSLVDYGFHGPSLSDAEGAGQWVEGDPFSTVNGGYWSSNTAAYHSDLAFSVRLARDGGVTSHLKRYSSHVWPVRANRLKPSIVPRARVEKTGQTSSYGPRDDGKLRRGVAWPIPRFTTNGDGTVRDNLTGLLWLRDAGCIGWSSWDRALSLVNELASGSCGLSDGSKAGDWRLPNIKELLSLIDYGFFNPALSNAIGTGHYIHGDPYLNVRGDAYWSSTTDADYSGDALAVSFFSGRVFSDDKRDITYKNVWPVRGPR